jgi:hypothetical protein
VMAHKVGDSAVRDDNKGQFVTVDRQSYFGTQTQRLVF